MRQPFYLQGWEDPENDDADAPDDSGDNTEDDDDDGPDPEAIAAKAAARAERKARRDLAKSLGFESIAEMQESVNAMREAESERQSEEERRQAEIQQREKELNDRAEQLARQQRELSINQALSSSNINPDRIQQAAILVRAELAEADLEVEEVTEVIATAVADLKKGTPEWFTKRVTGTNDGSDDGSPGTNDSNNQDANIARIKADFEKRGLVFD